ncbi:GNAT family N-acetyltransferase [Conexibacter stalactiti]|uniref:GNAT family N-acetyltransferase n=1 Tax=Conexibacter stalactiti TaxID=1940611 RepID=A0ABU4HRS1_9ACTN|nr:GNAT family N-acetyltransferase [Conexibacter stalactiti]MDW5594754.1 GNAT family N-acetyltransferase [Conexibacter stalactiti]MEC5035396.1 GNAT family N-acetyltransferase [Conexibacter stalactiti]
MSGQLCVRVAQSEDATAIATVHVRAWQAGYRGLLPDSVLDTLSTALRERQWHERLSGATGEWITTLVAVEQERVSGFCSLAAPSRDSDAGPRTVELAALYVDPERWGGGVADALLHAVRELLAEGSARWETLTLWMLEGNARALAFYRRWGLEPDGTWREDVLTGPSGQHARAPHMRLRGPLS